MTGNPFDDPFGVRRAAEAWRKQSEANQRRALEGRVEKLERQVEELVRYQNLKTDLAKEK